MAQFKKLEILPKLVDKQVMHFPGPRFEISPRAKKVKFQHLLPLTYLQCDRKGQFFKVLGYTFSYNSRPECLVTFLARMGIFSIFGNFLGYFEKQHFKSKKWCHYFLGIFWKHFGFFLFQLLVILLTYFIFSISLLKYLCICCDKG